MNERVNRVYVWFGLVLVCGLLVITGMDIWNSVFTNDLHQAKNTPPDFNMLVIGWDGVQRDHLWECYNKELSACPEGLPNLKQFFDGKIFDLTVTSGRTETKPGWSQILSGYNAKTTGIESNTQYQPLPEGYSVFEKLEDYFGADNIATIFLAGKGDHIGGVCAGEIDSVSGYETLGQPYCITKTSVDYFKTGLGSNQNVGEEMLSALDAFGTQPFFAFVEFAHPDNAGHSAGENSTKYTQGIVDDDVWLGQIEDKLQVLGIADKTIVYVVTDHGFGEDLTNHLNAPYGFFATSDSDVMRSGDRMDMGATILYRYGLRGTENGAPALNGYPLQENDPRRCIPEGEAYLDYVDAPRCCSGLTPSIMSIGGGSKAIIFPTGGIGDSSGICE